MFLNDQIAQVEKCMRLDREVRGSILKSIKSTTRYQQIATDTANLKCGRPGRRWTLNTRDICVKRV